MSNRNGQITVDIPGRGATTFNFGMGAWYDFCKRQQIPISGIFAVLRMEHPQYLSAIRDILYCTAAYHLETLGKEIDFTPTQVFAWVDEMDNEDFLKVVDTMIDSQFLVKFLGLTPPKRLTIKSNLEKDQPQ